MAAGKNRQIRELVIKTETQGTKAATDELSGLEQLLKASSTAATTLNSSLTKTAGIFKSATGHASGFAASLKSINTASSGNAKRIKSMEQYSNSILDLTDYMELLGQTSKTAAAGLDRVNAAGKGMSRSFETVTADGETLLDILEDMRTHLTDLNYHTQKVDTSLKTLNSGVNSTNSSIGKLNDTMGSGTGRQKKFNDGLRDMGKRGNSATRAMSSLLNATGPLTMAYAAVAANVYAATEAFRLLKEASDLQRLSEQVGNLSGALSGIDVGNLGKKLKEISGDALSFEDSLRTAARAVSFNFTTDQITGLAEGARKASIAIGIDFTDAMDRVTRGIAKQEVEVLDELGVVTRLIPAFQKYAGVLGKTVDQLTDVERQTALTNEVQKQLNERYSGIQVAATGWERLGTATKDVTTAGLMYLQDVLGPTADILATIFNYATGSGARDFKTLADTMNAAAVGGRSGAQLGALAEGAKVLTDQYGAYYDVQLKSLELQKKAVQGQMPFAVTARDVVRMAKEELEIDADISRITKEKNSYEENQNSIMKSRIRLKELLIAKGLTEAQIDSATSEQASALTAQGKAAGTATAEIAALSAANKKLKSSYDPILSQLQVLSDVPTILKDYEVLLDINKNLQDFNTAFGTSFTSLDNAKTSITGLVLAEREFAQSTKLAVQAKQAEAAILSSTTIEARKDQQLLLAELENKMDIERRHAAMGSLVATQDKIDNHNEVVLLKARAEQYDVLITKREFTLNAIKANNKETERSILLQTALDEARTTKKNTLRELNVTDGSIGLIKNLEKVQVETDKYSEQLRLQKELRVSLMSTQSLASEAEKLANTEAIDGLNRKLAMLDLVKQATTDIANGTIESENSLKQILMDTQLQQAAAADAAAVQPKTISNSGTELATSLTQIDQLSDRMAQLQARGLEGTEAYAQAQEAIVQASVNSMTSIMETAGSLFSSLSKLSSAEIDAQIAMVQKQEGNTYASQQKVKELQKKKIKEEEKAALMSIGIHTAQGIMMAFGTQPYPIAIGTSALLAAEGIIQSKTVKASAAGQLASMSTPSAQTVTVGESAGDASINVANIASASEYAYATGGKGDYSPRFTGGSGSGAASFMIGERGPELFTPDVPGSITPAGDVGGSGAQISVSIQGQFLDGADFEAYAERHARTITAAVERELQVNSTSLYR